MEMQTGNLYVGKIVQHFNCPGKFTGFIAEAKTAADLAHGGFAGTHLFQIKVSSDSYLYLGIRFFFRQCRQPIQLLFGIQIHITAGKEDAAKGLFSLVGTIIYNFTVLKTEIFCKTVFVLGYNFRVGTVSFYEAHKPWQGIRLKGIAHQIIAPVLFQ